MIWTSPPLQGATQQLCSFSREKANGRAQGVGNMATGQLGFWVFTIVALPLTFTYLVTLVPTMVNRQLGSYPVGVFLLLRPSAYPMLDDMKTTKTNWGSLGGKRSAEKLTKAQRRESASNAARARWGSRTRVHVFIAQANTLAKEIRSLV
jgi:hypothetical protein